MAIVQYLAMTAAEAAAAASLPEHMAWMACHFSPYSTGIVGIPEALPEGALLILNDRTPIHGHNPEIIAQELAQVIAEQRCSGLLLDFQTPEQPEIAALCRFLAEKLPCPVAVSSLYAQPDCPVFLPPVPLTVPVEAYLSPWKGRDIWLDAALDSLSITVTEQGSTTSPWVPDGETLPFQDSALHCSYRITDKQQVVCFHLSRTQDDLNELLEEAEAFGVHTAVGLYQELHK